MGKKDKKKGKGAEKTAAKTEKKLTAKEKKKLAKTGEDDIEKIILQIEHEEKQRTQIKEVVIDSPTRRANFTFIAHPEKDELILFGGEFYNGQKMLMYNDLIFYNINKSEWTLVKAPSGPPPRSGHQMVAISANKGQLWLFGGEFSSETQNQFYHYKDLWVYHMALKKWEKINSPGGPSARSGHRMCTNKKQLFVFGGFHDNLRDYKYFNDIYCFNTEDYTWKKIEPLGTPPAPRSGFQMVPLPDGKLLVYGGYSKERIKKDVDKGTIHTDMFLLTPDKNDVIGGKWKWSQVKPGGIKISPRCGTTITLASGNRAYSFGGVFDIEENEEDIAGTFFNELLALDLEKRMWRTVTVSGKKDGNQTKKKRRKEKDDTNTEDVEMDSDEGENVEEVNEVTTISDDGVFKVTVGPSSSSTDPSVNSNNPESVPVFIPPPRMNCGLAVKRSILYLYGGLIEDGDKQYTLCDFYSLDLHKLDEWKTIIADDQTTQEWIASESESEDEDGSSEEDLEMEDDDEEEEEEECDNDLDEKMETS